VSESTDFCERALESAAGAIMGRFKRGERLLLCPWGSDAQFGVALVGMIDRTPVVL
jgi:hypothetical protein